MKPLIRSISISTWSVLCLLAAGEAQAVRPWNDYQVIMWIGNSAYAKPEKLPLFFQRLREMGVTAGMTHGHGDPKPLIENGMPYYLENTVNRGLCLKWNSQYRDWDAFVTGWAKTRARAAFVREYGLYDPAWRDWARLEVETLVERHKPNKPLACDLRDELSITISANPFDFDFSAGTIAAFRKWLAQQYGTLEKLNGEWDTHFQTWEQVLPFTTDEIKNRMASGEAIPRGNPDWQALAALRFDPQAARKAPVRWNLAPWCDFRTFLDLSLADILGSLRETARRLDPETPVGIEGTQMPSAFGGYDLWRLSRALDWVEPYDIGGSRAILGSFMEGQTFLSTIGESDARRARQRLWHLLLEGDRGCIVWWSEDCIGWESADYQLTAKGAALAPVLKEMTSPTARLLLRARREYDPIAIVYSQPSIQVDWLIESTVDGRTWHRRFSSYEAQVNKLAAQRVRILNQLQAAGFSPRFIASPQIEQGSLKTGGVKALIMTGAYALSDKEIASINEFARDRHALLVYAGEPGVFDAHGRLRTAPVFAPQPEIGDYGEILRTRITPPVKVKSPKSGIATYRYAADDSRIVAFERMAGVVMGEDLKLKTATPPQETRLEIEVEFDNTAHVYDLRSGEYHGHTNVVRVSVEAWQPTLLALRPARAASAGNMAR